MIKLRKIEATGFRGARFKFNFDLTKDCKSIAVFGENGTGKSAITDAIEWYLTDQVKHLWKEDCKQESLRNILIDPMASTDVTLQFNDPSLNGTKTLSADLKTKTTSEGIESRGRIRALGDERVILRHSQISEFIGKSKSDKREQIAEIIGYEKLSDFRQTIQSTANALSRDTFYTTAKQNSDDAKTQLFKITGSTISTREGFIHAANKLAAPFQLGIIIKDSETYKACIDALRKKAAGKEEAEKGILLSQISKQALRVAESARNLLDKRELLIKPYHKLINDKNSIEQIKTENFLAQGRDILEKKIHTDPTCPFCLTPHDLNLLQKQIDERIRNMAALKRQHDALQNPKSAYTASIASLKTEAEQFIRDHKQVKEAEELTKTILPSLVVLSNWQREIVSAFNNYEPINETAAKTKTLEYMKTQAESLSKSLEGLVASLKLSAEEEKLIAAIESLRELRSEFLRYQQN